MLKITVVTLFLTAFSYTANAADNTTQIKVNVNGMVCDFCAQGLQKTFGKRDEVTKIDVDLDNQLITINLKPGQNIEDSKLSELILGNGFDVVEINRERCVKEC